MAVFYKILNLAGINAPILFKEHQQQESPEESPAAAGRGTEGRIHGGESGRGSRHKVGSSGSNTTAAAADTDTEAVPVLSQKTTAWQKTADPNGNAHRLVTAVHSITARICCIEK